MVSFSQIPEGYKRPLVLIEVDPSQAGTPTQPKYALLVGYKLAAGSAASNIPVAVGSQSQADAMFGAGSMLARMFREFFLLNKGQTIFCLPIDAPSGGTAQTKTITVSAAPTIDGIYNLYIAGQKVPVSVLASDSTANVATKINAAINAAAGLPVTAGVSTNLVTLTARHKGALGADIVVSDNILGVNGSEIMPTGLTVGYASGTAGAGVPDWSLAIPNLGDQPYEYVAMPFTDTASIAAWDLEYGFTDSGRWGWQRAAYGHVFGARRDTYSGHMTWGVSNNSGVISVLAVEATSHSPVWEWAAAYCARASRALSNDPARPLQTLAFQGIVPAPRQDRFGKNEVNSLAGAGLAIQEAGADGVPIILREQTMYQKNTLGQPDNAYELVTTLATLAALFRRLSQSITNKFPRHKLANDGTRFGPGQAIVTPIVIKAELVAEYRAAEYDGLVENGDAFKANLIVVRSTTDANRVAIVYPPDLVNQLRIFSVLAQFRLQYETTSTAA